MSYPIQKLKKKYEIQRKNQTAGRDGLDLVMAHRNSRSDSTRVVLAAWLHIGTDITGEPPRSPVGQDFGYSLSRLKRCKSRCANGAIIKEAMPTKANPENNA